MVGHFLCLSNAVRRECCISRLLMEEARISMTLTMADEVHRLHVPRLACLRTEVFHILKDRAIILRSIAALFA